MYILNLNRISLTYCVGLLVDTGLVMLSDSRTNARLMTSIHSGKMATFQQADGIASWC